MFPTENPDSSPGTAAGGLKHRPVVLHSQVQDRIQAVETEAVTDGGEVSQKRRLLFTDEWSVSKAVKPGHPFLLLM